MSDSFADFLVKHHVDSDELQQAARYYLSERTADMPVGEMKTVLAKAVGSERQLTTHLDRLSRTPEALDDAALAVLAAAWEEPGQSQLISTAILHAKETLPVIEIGVIAIVCMYGLYLCVTGGVKRSERTIRRTSDGGYEETTSTEFFGPEGALRWIATLFGRGG